MSIYGKYDVGRRKSKPIIYSLALAVLFTDIISYLQLMIMNTVTPSIYAFRLKNIGLLAAAFILQLLLIIVAVYAGNALFFKLHPPEKCCVVTSSQENLNEIVRGILKYKKQYEIVEVFDYRDKMLLRKLKDIDTVFMYNIPIHLRSEVTNYCYRTRKNVYYLSLIHI